MNSLPLKPRFAEFFAGIGLMRLGLERAGWEAAFANDIDEKKWEMYRHHFGADGEFHPGDIHDLNAEDIPNVTLATASFPCNDLSLAGARKGLAGQQSSAFWGFINVLKKMGERRPPLVLLENVVGFLSSHGGSDFEDALLALNELGYTVDALLIDASRFVPQSRCRLFVIGKMKQTSVISETLLFGESDCRPASLAEFRMWHGDIDWHFHRLPPLPTRKLNLADIIENVPANSKLWWNRERAHYLLNQMSVKHRAIADEMIRGKKVQYGTVFRRIRNDRSMAELRIDGLAGCLRTPRGGSARQILFVAGKENFSVRLITPRECARLMGANDFKISAPLNQALFGFGDAVCVPVVQWIAENYFRPVLEELSAAPPPLPTGVLTGVSYRKSSATSSRA